MMNGAKNGRLVIGDTEMDYVSFGSGKKELVIIPGLSDGLKTVKGTAIPLAFLYKSYAKAYRVHVFSRKNRLEEGYSTREMARDVETAMNRRGIGQASVLGLSQGGMIAQYLAIDFPAQVEKLVIAVSASRPNDTLRSVIRGWIDMAKADDYRSLFIDSIEKTHTDAYIRRKKYRLMYPLLTRVGKPKTFSRFIIQAHACIHHDAYDELSKITCPTLVIGGDSDHVVGEQTSEEIADQIPGSQRIIYKGLGHGAYAETKDFNEQVLQFLNEPV